MHSKYLRRFEGYRVGAGYSFKCPGCNCRHTIYTERSPELDPARPLPTWGFNGNLESPTFTPSVFCKTVRGDLTEEQWARYDAKMATEGTDAVLNDPEFKWWCHSFITDGRIQFLPDSSHHLAGQTVELGHFNLGDQP